MTQVLTKDNYYDVITNTTSGAYDFDILSFKFTEFNKWLKKQGTYGIFTVTQLYVGLLDLISYKFYGTESYWWIIATANNLLDPINDVYYGRQLIIPTRESVSSYIASITDNATPQVIEL